MLLEWPLVGRVEELGFVLDVLGGAGRRGVVIAGELGVGKTRLAREAVRAFTDAGDAVVEWVATTPATAAIPFGALSHLLPDAQGAEDVLSVLRAGRAALLAKAAGRPLLLAVDDAQWLDGASAGLVHQLVVQGAVTVLLTFRTGEVAADPVVGLWKDGLVERIELQPLGALDIDALVAESLGGPVEPGSLDRLRALSKGNPLFARELLLHATETGTLANQKGVWAWSGTLRPSTRVAAILEHRLARVGAEGRAALDHLAIGEPLAVEVLWELCGPDGFDEIERSGLAVVSGDPPQARLVHPLYSEVVRTAMGTRERRRIVCRLADALEPEAHRSRAQLLRVAAWRLEAGGPAPEWLFGEAADIANSVYDHALAERLARRAVADGGGVRAALALGEALTRQGRCVEGLEVLDPLADRATTDREHLAVAVARYFGLTTEHGFRVEFESVLLDAERRITDRQLLAFLRAQRATLLCFAGRLDESVALVDGPAAATDERSRLRSVTALGSAWLAGGRPESACELAASLLEPALRLHDELPQAPAWVLSTQLPALMAAGRLDDADTAIALVEASLAGQRPSADGPGFLALARGMSALHRGRARTAADECRSSVAALRDIARWRLPFPLVVLAEACALVGDAEGASEAIEEADALVVNAALYEGLVRRARGWAALARSQRSVAIDLAADAAEWAGAHGQHTAELFARHDVLRWGGGTRTAVALVDVASRVEGRWAPVFAAQASAVLDVDPKALEDASASFEEIGALLHAAEAAVAASAAYRASGVRNGAARTAARARLLATECEGARTPLLDELHELDAPVPLTSREREVVHLAADGMPSAAIAGRLFVSVRTVEGHLHRAYSKLGVTDRTALAAVLNRPPVNYE